MSRRLGRIAARLEPDIAPTGAASGGYFLNRLMRWARQQLSIVEIHLRSFDVRGTWGASPLPEPSERVEFVLDPAPRAELTRRMRSSARSSVKKPERRDLTVRLGGAEDGAQSAELDTLEVLRECRAYHPGWALDPGLLLHRPTVT
jgi:hypothetical protein